MTKIQVLPIIFAIIEGAKEYKVYSNDTKN